jgi:23S rRNA (adenine1618-N6)-methyltransferase
MDLPQTPRRTQSGTLHPRNLHAGRYDLATLSAAYPELKKYLRPNPAGDQTINFADDQAVRCLNHALLAHHYGVKHWQIPAGYLCPPVPGRADYIHYMADVLAGENGGAAPTGKGVKVLDVGTGANCVYPIIGNRSYGWSFVGTDIDPLAIKTARAIVEANPSLRNRVKIIRQTDPASIFGGVLRPTDHFALSMCNPPFHASLEGALAETGNKVRNLAKRQPDDRPKSPNFGGQANELWCPGGELQFVKQMIRESVGCAQQVGWFSSLVSKKEHLRGLEKSMAQAGAKQIKIIPMSQGNKRSRAIAWSFRSE